MSDRLGTARRPKGISGKTTRATASKPKAGLTELPNGDLDLKSTHQEREADKRETVDLMACVRELNGQRLEAPQAD